jgi:single-stranded DNA-binding protein
MNSNLNSILLEGNLVKKPAIVDNGGKKPCTEFTIISNRYYKTADGVEKEEIKVKVQCFGDLADTVHADGKKDRGLRVVGRVANDNKGQVYIVAEHVEFKPERKMA